MAAALSQVVAESVNAMYAGGPIGHPPHQDGARPAAAAGGGTLSMPPVVRSPGAEQSLGEAGGDPYQLLVQSAIGRSHGGVGGLGVGVGGRGGGGGGVGM